MALLHTRLLSIIDQARASVEGGDHEAAVRVLELGIYAIEKATGLVPPGGEGEPAEDKP